MILLIEFLAGFIVGLALSVLAVRWHKPVVEQKKESATKELIRQRLYASGWRPE